MYPVMSGSPTKVKTPPSCEEATTQTRKESQQRTEPSGNTLRYESSKFSSS